MNTTTTIAPEGVRPADHRADAVRELERGYAWRARCACGWAHPWRYATEQAALTMADAHAAEGVR